ncbi:interferon-induced transmembrane protein [Streptomyces sp. 3211.6]|nr:interferon-induced transmembrane protein [Streptomyces sp. 3211.6]RPF45174.1 interferon-induced transmembrane protein [Streptomyces sp. Ag109_G2-6]
MYEGRVGAPASYLTPAILVTLFCFLPTGIAAIVFASQVQSKWTVGDFAGAAEASRKARLYVVVSVLAGCLAWVILIAIGFASTPSTPTAPTP